MRKKKFKKTIKKIIKNLPEDFNDAVHEATFGLYALAHAHESIAHNGNFCKNTRIALVATLACHLKVLSVDDFSEVEILAAKMNREEEIEIE